MAERKLFYALDHFENQVVVENVNKEMRHNNFFCPFCKAKVVPRQGELNVWHFAHMGEACNKLKLNSNASEEQISIVSENEISISEIPFETDKYTCKLCKSAGHKDYGIRLGGTWICKECYTTSDVYQLHKLFVDYE